MAGFRKRHRETPRARAAAIAVGGLFWTSSMALAAQGTTTATTFAQVATGILVYGMSAFVVGAGLIGALRKR